MKRQGRLSLLAASATPSLQTSPPPEADSAVEGAGGPAHAPEAELMEFLGSLDEDMGTSGLLEGAEGLLLPGGLHGELDALLREGGGCGVDWLGGTPFAFAQLEAGGAHAGQLQHAAVALKCPHPPDQLPSGLRAALGGWAQPMTMQGVAQPGCTLLTVDMLVEAPTIGALRAAQLAQALRSEGGGCEALACACGLGAEDSQDDALRAPQPLTCSLALQPRDTAVVVQLRGCVQEGQVLRCRAHGTLLRCAVEGTTLTVHNIPRGFTHGCLLLDLQPSGMPLAPPARPRPVLLTSCPRAAEELRLRLGGLPEAQTLPLLLLLGQALQPDGAARGEGEHSQGALGQRACAACLRHKLPHTLRLVLSVAGRTPAGALSLCVGLAAQQSGDQQATLLALLLAHAQPGDAHAALHSVALLCASHLPATAIAGCAAAELLTAHCASAAHAWHTLQLHLPMAKSGKTLWTPHDIALRGTHPHARRLTQQLQARLQSAVSELDALLRAQPAGQARLNALQGLPCAPPPGVDAQHWALCLHLARQPLRCSAAERSDTRRLRRSVAVWVLVGHILHIWPATILALRAWLLGVPPLRVEELHRAMRSGLLPLSMLREFYNAALLFSLWLPIHGCVLLVALLGRRSTVLRLEALLQHAFPAMNLLLFYAWHTLLHLRTVGRWRLDEAGADLMWDSNFEIVQVAVSISYVARSMHLPPRWATLFLLTRACYLVLGIVRAELYVVPPTVHARTLLPIHVLVLVCAAAWRCGSPGKWRRHRVSTKEA